MLVLKARGIARAETPIQRLDKDGGRVSLKNSLQPVDVHLQVKEMVLGRALVGVVWDVQLHELVKPAKPVAKRRVLNAFLVRYHIVVESLEARYRVHDEVTVAGYLTNGVVEECDVDDLGQRRQ